MEFLDVNNILRGLIGITSILGICYLFSSNRKQISWKLVFSGLLIQFDFCNWSFKNQSSWFFF